MKLKNLIEKLEAIAAKTPNALVFADADTLSGDDFAYGMISSVRVENIRHMSASMEPSGKYVSVILSGE